MRFGEFGILICRVENNSLYTFLFKKDDFLSHKTFAQKNTCATRHLQFYGNVHFNLEFFRIKKKLIFSNYEFFSFFASLRTLKNKLKKHFLFKNWVCIRGTFLSHSSAAKSIEMDQIRFLRFKTCVFRRRDGAHGDKPQSRQIAFQISSGLAW